MRQTQLPDHQITQLPNLLNFLVRRVLAAPFTELFELQTARRRLLILGRRVVPFFAVAAL
jgi:hypothetical protein